jgi:PBSX family phage terminase large subunit
MSEARAVIWKPHSVKQEQGIFSNAPILICATGIQWGKTRVGAIKTKLALHHFTDPSDNFLVLAPTYKIMQQSTLPAFMQVMDGLGTLNKSTAEFKMHHGGTVYFRTATDPDSIVGVTDVRFIWGDEAGKYGLYFWENIQARAAFKEAQIVLTTSPYTLNWIYREFVKPKLKDKTARSDCDLIHAASWENPFFPVSTIKRARENMDPRRFNMIFGGEFGKAEGLVYDCFDEDENVCEAFTLPNGTKYFAGVDWGHTHPFVCVVRAVTPNGRHYQVSEVYKSGLTLSQIVEICRQKKAVYNIERFYCGPDQPGNIEELCRNGVPALPADNRVQLGIDKHYELIKTRQYKIFSGTSPFTLDEYSMYHYPEPADLQPDKDRKERGPVKQTDDAMDANRYVTIMTMHGVERRTPKVPVDVKRYDMNDPNRFRKRKAGFGDQTENWGG